MTPPPERPTLVESLGQPGLEPPALVVADNATIGRLAPAWAATFAALGWRHRVRLCEPRGEPIDHRMIAALVAEASGLGARTVVAAGGPGTVAAASAAAAALGLPVVAPAD